MKYIPKNKLPEFMQHSYDIEQTKSTKDKDIAFYVVTIEITKIGIERHFPLIVNRYREDGRQMNENACCRMCVGQIMLEDLIKFQDIEFKVLHGYIWKGDSCSRDLSIRSFIKQIYDLRLKAKREDNPIQLIYKLVMNSCYGKQIQKPIKKTLRFAQDKEELYKIIESHPNQFLEYYQLYNSNTYCIELQKTLNNQFNNVTFGIICLDMSKRIMNEVMCLTEDLDINIYYQDTDSMHIERSKLSMLDQKYKELYARKLIVEDGCQGQLEQFHNDFDELKHNPRSTRIIILGKKMYLDVLTNDSNEYALHYRMKAIPSNCVKDTAEKYYGNIVHLYEHLRTNPDGTLFNIASSKPCFKLQKNGLITTLNKFDRLIRSTKYAFN